MEAQSQSQYEGTREGGESVTLNFGLEHLERGSPSKRLVVFTHGYRLQAKRNRQIKRSISEQMPDADLYAPPLPYAATFSTTPMAEIAAQMLEDIDTLWSEKTARDGETYEEIILVGHSMGAVLARKLFVCAHGEVTQTRKEGEWSRRDTPAPFEAPLSGLTRRPWAPSISRLVLLAAMSRGWSIEGVRSKLEALVWNIGSLIGHLMPTKPTIFDIRRGAPFISQTRLQWLALMDSGGPRDPSSVIVTQLLGTVDNIVAPDDNLDFALDSEDPTFFLLQVPFSDHTSLLEMETLSTNDPVRKERYERFSLALTGSVAELREASVPRSYLSEHLPPPPDYDVEHAVFVIHGIRDLGYWTQKIAAEIKRQSNGTVRTLSPSYGFFAMAPFVLPWVRRQKAEWFMDHFVQARAMYPNADFSYVGHSNGTYILARALDSYSGCRFRNVVFAGSVVRADYDWTEKLSDGRVARVLNYVATHDWVVAMFPFAVRHLRWFDLGGAGHVGFGHRTARVSDQKYVRGDHGAGIKETHWDDIARFVQSATSPAEDQMLFRPRQPLLMRLLGTLSPIVLALVLVLLLWGLGTLGFQAFFVRDSAFLALAFIAAVWLVWTVVTRL